VQIERTKEDTASDEIQSVTKKKKAGEQTGRHSSGWKEDSGFVLLPEHTAEQ
jgi:hypothetical protein